VALSYPAVPEAAPEAADQLDFRPRRPPHPSPADWRDVVLYQVVLDRFDDNKPEGTTASSGREPDQGWHFQGGTLPGLRRRLDYIRGLGATGIWLSCPFKQRPGEQTYHGYAVQDFLDIDPRFGTIRDLVDFVADAHERGMVVVLDVVIDHAADLFHYVDGKDRYEGGQVFEIAGWHDGGEKPTSQWDRDEGVWPRELQRPEAFVRQGAMDPMNAAAAEAKDGDFMSLKKIDLMHPPTLSAMIKIYKHWIAVTDVDGFRIDAMRHVRHPAASDFVHAIREYAYSIGKLNFLQVGEVAGDDQEMTRYVGSNVELLAGGGTHDPDHDPDSTGDYPQLDAVIDFELHRRLIPILLDERPATDLEALWADRRAHFRDFGQSGRSFLTYLENHDQGARDRHRLLFGTVDQTPDGYDRPGGDPRLAAMASTVLLLGMGIPCLYYGTEQGFDGGGKDDFLVREAMFGGKWGPFETTGKSHFDPDHPIYHAIARTAEVRAAEPTLRYGRAYLRELSGDGVNFGLPEHNGTFAIARVLDVTEILVVVNPSLEPAEVFVTLDGNLNPAGWHMRDLLDPSDRHTLEQADDGRVFVHTALPPRGVRVLRLSLD
jgi:glycosidase